MVLLSLGNVICLTIGFIIGLGVYHVFFSKHEQTEQLTHTLAQTKNELTTYQTNVDEHFKKTADLLNQFSNSYREVHRHIANGAQNLSHHPMPSEVTLAKSDPAPALETQATAKKTTGDIET